MKILKTAPLFLLIFVFLIGFSLIDAFTPERSFSELENKKLNTFPAFSYQTLVSGDFAKNYETYITDQFLFRDSWVSMKSASEMLLLKTENNDIVYGKDGYLFPKFYDFDPEVLRNNLSSIDTFSAAMKAPVAVMVVPSKYYPLVDYVPKGLPFVDQGYYITEINEYLSKNATIINAKDILTINNDDYIYYRTDHHWTTLGAWYAYSQFAPFSGFMPFEYGSRPLFSIDDFLGTSYSKSREINPESDTIEYYDFSIKKLTADGKEYDSLYNAEQFTLRDKYAAFLQGNNGYTVIQSVYSEEKLGSILIIKDSFANSLVPMLTEHYNTIHVIDPRFYKDGYKQFADMSFDQILVLYSFENIATDKSIAFLSVEFED